MAKVHHSSGGHVALAAGHWVEWGIIVNGDYMAVVVPRLLSVFEPKLEYSHHAVMRTPDKKTHYRIRITNPSSETAHFGLRWIIVY